MRKKSAIVVAIFSLLFQITKVQGQTFTPYLDSTSTWYEISGGSDIIYTYLNHNKYYIDGDTLISGTPYYKVFYDAIDSTWNWQTNTFIGATTYNYIYSGGIREDSLKRFYFIYNNQTTDTLLFDFNLETGDTIPVEMYSWCNIPNETIVSIDTVYLGIQPLKKLYVPSFSNTKAMYEGIGGTGGLIWNGSLCQFFETGSCLIAYKKGVDSLYINCGLNSTGLQVVQPLAVLDIFPIPTSSTLNIRCNNTFQSIVEIYNDLGLLIRRINISPQEIHQLNVKNWRNGLYIIKLINDKEIISIQKVVIVHE